MATGDDSRPLPEPDAMRKFSAAAKTCGLKFCTAALWFAIPGLFVWALGAVYCLDLLPNWLSVLLATAYLVSASAYWRWSSTRSRWLQMIAASVVLVYLLTLLQRPSNDRRWADDNAVLPNVTVQDGDVQITGFRSKTFRSESDYDVSYSDLHFPLAELDRVWFVVQRFTALEGIAHNFLTFSRQAKNGPEYFSVSVEIRRETDEAFDPVKGLYREYELIYVFADERDQIVGRTVFRPDDRVFLYPVNATRQDVQKLFLDIVGRAQKLHQHPEFYHSLTNNCTNNIVNHAYKFTPLPISSLDPRVIAPGFADRLAYAKGLIGRPGESFGELRNRCRIDKIARSVGITADFSEDIRR